MGATPFDMNHKEPTRATHTIKQSSTLKSLVYTPLGRHIKHVDQEPQCQSVRFSCKDRPQKIVQGRIGKGETCTGYERPQTRLRDGVDGFLQVVIKQPKANVPVIKETNVTNHTADRFLFDLVFYDTTAKPNGLGSINCKEQSKLMASIQNLGQCLKVNTGGFEHPRKGVGPVDDFSGRYPHLQKQMTIVIKDKNGTGSRKKQPGISKKSHIKLDVGQMEGVKGVGIGPRTPGAEQNEKVAAAVQFPALSGRSHTMASSQVASRASVMKNGGVPKLHDVIWLSGSRPSYIHADGSTLHEFLHPPGAEGRDQRQCSSTAKSDSSVPVTALQKQKTQVNDSTMAWASPGHTGYLETDFGFHRERLRGDVGMSMKKHVPDSSQLEKVVGDIAQKHIYSCQIPSLHTRSSRAYQSVESLRRTIYPFSKQRHSLIRPEGPAAFQRRGGWDLENGDKSSTSPQYASAHGKIPRSGSNIQLASENDDALPPIYAMKVNVPSISAMPKYQN